MNALFSRFGAPGRIAFREGPGGLPIAALACRFGTCELSLYGAHVLSYRPTGHGPVLFMSKQSRFERGQPIRGGIPVCWPWFGPAAPPQSESMPAPQSPPANLPLHGFVRVTDWDIAASEYTADTTQITLSLDDSGATRRFWPFAFTLTMRITLGQSLALELTALNRDTRPFSFSQAFHPYFLVRQIMDVTVRGLDRAPCRDRLTGHAGTQEGLLNIRGETDRIHTPQHPQCALHDPGIGRTIALVYGGASRLVVWNPWIDKARTMPDFGNDEYARMICLEPANTDGGEITLNPGESHTLSLAIQASTS